MSADNTTPPASPAATDEEVARMVERLTKPVYTFHINEKGGPNITVEGENRFAMEREVSPLADAGREAADLLARVAEDRDSFQRVGIATQARLTEAERERDEAVAHAERVIQSSIDRAPEPLRRLGEWLSAVLDEDQWSTAERLLLGAINAEAALEKAREALTKLESVASEVARYGAQTGPQWTKLNSAVIGARAALAAMEAGDGK